MDIVTKQSYENKDQHNICNKQVWKAQITFAGKAEGTHQVIGEPSLP